MRSMKFIGQTIFLMLGIVISLQAVPPLLTMQVRSRSMVNPLKAKDSLNSPSLSDGKITYWSNDGTSVNGSEPQASVKAP